MKAAQITVYPRVTRRRIARLEKYVQANLLSDQEFHCQHVESCRASTKHGHHFHEGTMSHVGHRYDLAINGKPLRVMVVGQESGLPKDPHSPWISHVSIRSRYEQVHDGAGLRRRYYAGDGFPGRNPHMRGTASLLRLLTGTVPGADYEGEFVQPVNGRRFHCFDGFALVNRLLCSTGPTGTSQGTPTGEMLKNCARHFTATIEILEPTIVVLQGHRVAKSVEQILVPRRRYGDHLYEAKCGDDRMLVCSFSHPSAHGALRWGDNPDAAYLEEIVAPTIRRALRRLQGQA